MFSKGGKKTIRHRVRTICLPAQGALVLIVRTVSLPAEGGGVRNFLRKEIPNDGRRVRNIHLDIIISLCKLRRLLQSINNIMLIDSSLPEGALGLIVRTISLPAEGGGVRNFLRKEIPNDGRRVRYIRLDILTSYCTLYAPTKGSFREGAGFQNSKGRNFERLREC